MMDVRLSSLSPPLLLFTLPPLFDASRIPI